MEHTILHLPAGVRARRLALSRWDEDGGAGTSGPQEGYRTPSLAGLAGLALAARTRRRLRTAPTTPR